MSTAIRTAVLLVLLTLILGSASARAETVACTPITTIPTVITAQGIYCFTGNLNTAITSGSAIDIQANNVVLDLNGFKLGGLAAGLGTTAHGIAANGRQNLTIKNGTMRGFLVGIFVIGLPASQGHVVEDMRLDQNTSLGMRVNGQGSIIRNNQVVATGGTTAFGPNPDAYGLDVSGTGVRVLNNDVINVFAQGSGTSWGIFFNTVNDGLAINNRITEADKGIEYSGSTGKYRDNVTSSVTTPYTGGTNIGNNS